jgi:hypothetical protein
MRPVSHPGTLTWSLVIGHWSLVISVYRLVLPFAFNLYPFIFFTANCHCPLQTAYSERRLFAGLTIAALIAWKLTVISAISIAARPAAAKIHHCTGAGYANP